MILNVEVIILLDPNSGSKLNQSLTSLVMANILPAIL